MQATRVGVISSQMTGARDDPPTLLSSCHIEGRQVVVARMVLWVG